MRRYFPLVLAFCMTLICVLTFAAVSADDGIIGDVDGDGVVTYDDAQIIFDYVAGIGSMTQEELKSADVDGDGRVTVADAVQVFHFASGVLRSLPYVQPTGGVLTVMKLPDRIDYTVGDGLDLTGIEVCILYSDGSRKEVDDYAVTGYEPTVGVKIIVISYDGMRTAFTITVYPKEIVEIGISSLPGKIDYVYGEALDLTGLVITAYYEDGTYEDIADYVVSGFDGSVGVNTVYIQYGKFRLGFDVTVGE